jgi:hypothetical protein
MIETKGTMKKSLSWIFSALFVCLGVTSLEAHMIHQRKVAEEWKEENLPEFDELMISWNADRPALGRYHFYVSVKADKWSPWLLYATWGNNGQTGFLSTTQDAPVRVYQDALEVMEGKKATGFQIKIVPEGDTTLDNIHSLHVYTNSDRTQEPKQKISYSSSVYLPVPGLSQMVLDHVRSKDLCSPTSTAAVSRYLSDNSAIDPVLFAQHSWDSGFDIFGNWVFNVAQASTELGKGWSCWVERLSGFDEIYQRLHQQTPVIVSVRGPLPGSALPYSKGHLMAVIGFDHSKQKVICMDPAFSSDEQTHVLYDLSDFVQAWSRRGRIAYVFSRSEYIMHKTTRETGS